MRAARCPPSDSDCRGAQRRPERESTFYVLRPQPMYPIDGAPPSSSIGPDLTLTCVKESGRPDPSPKGVFQPSVHHSITPHRLGGAQSPHPCIQAIRYASLCHSPSTLFPFPLLPF